MDIFWNYTFRQVYDKLGQISKCLAGPCQLVCGGPRRFVRAWSHRNQLESVVAAILLLDELVPSLNVVSCDKKMVSVWQTNGPTNFDH